MTPLTPLIKGGTNSERISVVLPGQTKKDLDKLCEIEKRSISNCVYLLVQYDIDKQKSDGKLK